MQTLTPIDPAHDILRTERQPLDAIFRPRTVAVVGASERAGSVGRTLLWNLISHPFGGTVYPVNPKRHSVLGIQAHPSLAAVPEQVDLAVIATPAEAVPAVVTECVEAGVKGAIIISAGFKETGEHGIALEQQILEEAHRGQMRIIGPNCLGVMNPHLGLNATFASAMANPGNVAFISQSGALCTSILDWSFHENVGFSAFISIGSMLDVSWGDLIDYLGDDPHTQSIVIYMESIGNARSFLSAAREVALTKPIIVINAGRTEAAAQAAASHTGSLAGSDQVLSAAFRRCGVLRVDSIDDLFNMAAVLAKQPRPKGKRLTILTNAGGPGVLTTDALIGEGGELAPLSSGTIQALDQVLPQHWSHGNPIDILGDADANRYAQSLCTALEEPNSDGLLIVLTPQAMSDPTGTASSIASYLKSPSAMALPPKPILASWMGGESVSKGAEILNQADIFTFPYPDTAAHIFNNMWRYSYNLQGIYETPALPDESDQVVARREQAAQLLSKALEEDRTLLTEWESKQILKIYDIPTIDTRIATTPEDAITAAEAIGFPVVLKLHSNTITHKTDVGGVKLNLRDQDAIKEAFDQIHTSVSEKVGVQHFQGVTVQPMIRLEGYELIIGSSLDPQFGPVLLFGLGGQLVEVFRDSALALPPLTTTLARRMMEQTQIYGALQGVRGRKAVDLQALEQLLVHFSQLVVEQPRIKEIDINPLLASSESLLALDARIILHESALDEVDLPKPAIRPYPIQYVSPWITQASIAVTIRPIRPEDEPLIIQFHQTLSEESIYLRYFHLIKLNQRVAHERLIRICFNDYDREIALVVDHQDPETHTHQILGVGRLSKLHGINEAEFGMLVNDHWQGQGIGTELLGRLIQIGRDEGLDRIQATILSDNQAMQHICRKQGFQLHPQIAEGIVQAQIDL